MPLVVTVAGISGSGKTTLIGKLQAAGYSRPITATTRPARAGERNGRDYWFMSEAEFLRRERTGEFIESNRHDGNLYGLPVSSLRSALGWSNNVAVVLDPNGARKLKEHCSEVNILNKAVFLDSPILPTAFRLCRGALARRGRRRLLSLLLRESLWRRDPVWDSVLPSVHPYHLDQAARFIQTTYRGGTCGMT